MKTCDGPVLAAPRATDAGSASSIAAQSALPHEDEDLDSEAFRAIDRMREALSAGATGGLSPAALALAFFDWSIHLASAPGKRMEIADKAARNWGLLLTYMAAAATRPEAPPCIEALPGDNRFRAEGWQKQPYTVWAQAFLLCQQWWHNVTRNVPGMTPHHEDVVSFTARQLLDMFSPSNIPFANPEVIHKAMETAGANFAQGFRNWLEDASRRATRQPRSGRKRSA